MGSKAGTGAGVQAPEAVLVTTAVALEQSEEGNQLVTAVPAGAEPTKVGASAGVSLSAVQVTAIPGACTTSPREGLRHCPYSTISVIQLLQPSLHSCNTPLPVTAAPPSSAVNRPHCSLYVVNAVGGEKPAERGMGRHAPLRLAVNVCNELPSQPSADQPMIAARALMADTY